MSVMKPSEIIETMKLRMERDGDKPFVISYVDRRDVIQYLGQANRKFNDATVKKVMDELDGYECNEWEANGKEALIEICDTMPLIPMKFKLFIKEGCETVLILGGGLWACSYIDAYDAGYDLKTFLENPGMIASEEGLDAHEPEMLDFDGTGGWFKITSVGQFQERCDNEIQIRKALNSE